MDNMKTVRTSELTHRRLCQMRAQALVVGYRHVKSLDDALDLLLQIWDKALAKSMIQGLVPLPKA